MKRNVYQNTMVKDLLSIIIALILLSISIYSQDNIWTIYNVGNSLPSDIVKGITVAPNGNVLIGTQSLIFGGGLAIYDGNTWKTIDITTPSFPSNNIYTVSTDKTGNIYIWYKNTKTSGGAIFNGSEWSPMNISGLDSTINLLKPLIFDNKERMWAGLHKSNFTGTSLGIGYYDSTWHNIKLDSNYYNFFINDMVFDKNDNLWVGTSYGIFKLNNNNEWEKIDSSKGLFDRNVLALAPDNFGNIWIGSTHGIYFYNGNYFTKYDSSNSGLQDNVIYSLLLDQNQNLWIATGDSGLIKFDGSTFTKFYRSEWKYYDSHELRKLALDSNGNIWMIVGSNNGVAVLHPDLVSVEDNKLKNDINIYPNPFFNVINIDYQNLSQNNLNIELLDLLSNKVYSKDFGIMDIGLHNLKITIDNPISQGSYYLLINSNNKLIFKELIHLE